ncbi:hypothetical protein L7F22_005872 [Adiantum nelumboides]|nr:hypothetical protein [Adiantum nelumboides]MCO5552361.1 hypothetical protein [Adiantum nelumboides]
MATLILFAFAIFLQALLWCSGVRAQKEGILSDINAACHDVMVTLIELWTTDAFDNTGFLSLACGSRFTSANAYVDANGVEWVGDANVMQEGEARLVGKHPNDALSSMRLFTGNASKYCYSLSNSAVQSGTYFLIRAFFWPGTSSPYKPESVDGVFRFKLLVEGDEWSNANLRDSHNKTFKEMYVRAQRRRIDICLARRSSPDGNAPFISALELRPIFANFSAFRYFR